MLDLVRDSPFGTILNYLSGGRILPFPEQRPDYKIPERYLAPRPTSKASSTPTTRVSSLGPDVTSEKDVHDHTLTPVPQEPLPLDTSRYNSNEKALESGEVSTPTKSIKVLPPDDPYIVTWDGPDDQANPYNWSLTKRTFITANICLLTVAAHIGSTIYTSAIPGIMEEFNVSTAAATVGLSLYVFCYGAGSLIFSPLQELPSLGRNTFYVITVFFLCVLHVPLALANNLGTVLVLRFFTGIFASPALATGGASLCDIFTVKYVPYVIGLWALAGCAGPVLGPTAGGFIAESLGWRWTFWEMVWIAGLAGLFVFFLLPETLPDTILLRKAQRLRKVTGNQELRSLSEIKQAQLTAGAIAREYLLRPFELMREPAVFFLNAYVGFAYLIYYLWFEAFPIVFVDLHGFSLGFLGLAYSGILLGGGVAYAFYVGWYYFYLNRIWEREGRLSPEQRLELAIYSGVFIPISLFMFGWTARADVHWIVPMIATGLYMPGIFLLFQTALLYLPLIYPAHAASVLAGNDFFRGASAAFFPIFGRIFFLRMGLGPACTLLGGVGIIMIPILWLLVRNGEKLRKLSKFASADA